MERALIMKERISSVFERIWWDCNRFFENVSRFDIFMFSLLIFPIGIKLYVNIPLKTYIEKKREINVEQSETQSVLLDLKPLVKQEPQLENVSQAFLTFFPEKKQMNDDLFKMKSFIIKNKLEIKSIGYEYQELKDVPILKVKIKVKLKGSYRAQRNLTYDLFSNFPHLSMPVFSLNGENDQVYESDIDLNLYYRTEQTGSLGGDKNAPPNL